MYQKFFLLSISILFSLLFCELALRFIGRYKAPPDFTRLNPDPIYMFDADFGYKLIPDDTFKLVYPPKTPGRNVVSNSLGFRKIDKQPGDGKPVIFMLGDSFTFGLGLEQGKEFPQVLQNLNPQWDIWNLGMNGYGTDLMLMSLESASMSHSPDIACMMIYTDDMRRIGPYYAGEGFPIPRFILEKDTLKKIPHPNLPVWRRTHLWQLTNHVSKKATDFEFKMNHAILKRFVTRGRQKGIQPCIVYFPGKWKITPTDSARQQFLTEFSREFKIPYLDLTTEIGSNQQSSLFLDGDIHWNEAGHRKVALLLNQFLGKIAEGNPKL